MRKLILTIALASVALGFQAAGSANAADREIAYRKAPAGRTVVVESQCPQYYVCGPAGSNCGYKHFCRVGCPDGYSCSPLYGAYGPYGGTAYWGGYTSVGWGPRYYR